MCDLRWMRGYLIYDAAVSIANAFVRNRLDYYNCIVTVLWDANEVHWLPTESLKYRVHLTAKYSTSI